MNSQYEAALGGILIIVILGFILSFSNLLFGFTLPALPYRPDVEKYFWTFRGIDILVQAFLILAASSAVAALFRREKEEDAGGE